MPGETMTGRLEQVLKQKLGRLRGGRVLDVATGHGDFAFLLARVMNDYDEIIGIDASQQEADAGGKTARRQQHGEFRFLKMDAHKLDFPDSSFDTVAISNALHHMADPKQVFAEMMRVLKPGGLCIVREIYSDGLDEAQKSHLLFHHLRADIDTLKGVFHRYSYQRAELARFCQELGLAELDTFDLGPGDDDPLENEAPEHLTQMLDIWLGEPGFSPDITRRIEEVREHIREHGFLPASSLCAIGRKDRG